MSKRVKYGLAGLAAVAILGLGAFLWLDSIVVSSTETIGTDLTGTAVRVDGASVSPFSGTGTIRGFRVANPDGYGRDYAVQVEAISVDLDVASLWSDPTLVEEIIVEEPVLNLARQGGEINLREIPQNVNRASETESSSKGTLMVEHFLMEEGAVDLYVEAGGERSVQAGLPSVEMQDVGAGEGGRAVGKVVQQVVGQVFGAALKAVGGNWRDRAEDAVRDLFN